MRKPKPPRTQTKTQRVKQQQAQTPAPETQSEPELPRVMAPELFLPSGKPPEPPPLTLEGGRRAADRGMERTLGEEVEGLGETVDVGQPSPRGAYSPSEATIADRTRQDKGLPPPGPSVRPLGGSMEEIARAHARSISTDLHARDEHGKVMPTLADRVRTEGVPAQLGGKTKKT